MVFRGYEREAVDRYVASVIELITELEATQTREGTVQRALEEVGEQTSRILQQAHESAEEISSHSRAQAEGRLARAEREAEQMISEAEAEAQRIRTDARGVWQQRTRLIEELRRLSDEVLTVADDALERLDPPEEHKPASRPPEPVSRGAPGQRGARRTTRTKPPTSPSRDRARVRRRRPRRPRTAPRRPRGHPAAQDARAHRRPAGHATPRVPGPDHRRAARRPSRRTRTPPELMADRTADARWTGDLKGGEGTVRLGSGAYRGAVQLPVAVRGRRGRHQPRGADRRRPRGLLLDAGGQRAEPGRPHGGLGADHREGVAGSEGRRARHHRHRAHDRGVGLRARRRASSRRSPKRPGHGCIVSKALAGTEITLDARLTSG